jgi:ABC-2 type transport system permease protein
MRKLVEALGVDYAQWKALTLVALKLDFRQGSFGQSRMRRATSGVAKIANQLIIYSMYGLFMALLVWASRDLFFAGTIVMTYMMFMVGTAVLLDHSAALTSPADYGVLGFRPVSSRTYFAARLANVLAYTTVLATVAGYLPVVSLFLRDGPAVGVAGILAFYACATTTSLAMLFVYGWLLRAVGPTALRRTLSYVQLIMSFAVYGGYFFIAEVVGRSALTSFVLPRTKLLLLYPATWYEAYLDIAAGHLGASAVLPALASIVLPGVLLAALGGRLSMDYADRISALASSTQKTRPARASSRQGLWFRTGEARAVALLVRSQFRNDQRFRMGVLSILPLTLIYILMGVHDGNVQDPFLRPAAHSGISLVTVAVMMFPTMLKLHLTRSDSYRASWVFFACPADRLRIIRSAKNVLVASFLVPYLGFVALVLSYLTRAFWHVLVHVALLGLISHLLLQVVVLTDPELPFSQPFQVGQRSRQFFFLIGAMAVAGGLMQGVTPVIYASLVRTVAAFAGVGLLSLLVDRLTRTRVDRQARSLEFAG